MSWPRYEPAGRCTGSVTPGAQALMAWGTSRFPVTNWGIYNCRTVVGGVNRSVHGEGRACDFGAASIARGDLLLEVLLEHRMALGIQLVIWNRRIYSAQHSTGAVYGGPGRSPHTDHLHVELTWDAARTLTVPRIVAAVAGMNVAAKPTAPPKPPPPPPPAPVVVVPAPSDEEDDMARKIIRHHDGSVWMHHGLHRVKLNTGPTHQANRDRIAFWEFFCGPTEDLSGNPIASQLFLDASAPLR